MLPHAYKSAQTQPFIGPEIEFDEGYTKYSGTANLNHEAGFDAYMAGYLFAKLAYFVGITLK